MSVNDIYEVAVFQSLGGIQVVNVHHLRDVSGSGTAAALAADWAAQVIPGWKTGVSNNLSFQQVTARKINPNTGEFAATTLTGTGTNAQQSLPVVCAGVITWRTGAAGRRRRGRTFVCGLQDLAGQVAVLTSANQTVLGSMAGIIFARYVTNSGTSGYKLVVYSRKNAALAGQPSPPPAFLDVTSYTAQPDIATMGSRRAGRGN